MKNIEISLWYSKTNIIEYLISLTIVQTEALPKCTLPSASLEKYDCKYPLHLYVHPHGAPGHTPAASHSQGGTL